MDVRKTIGHRHSHHGHKNHSSTLCSSIPKIWMVIQNILATDDRQAWKSLTQDADHTVHIKNALLMSRMSNDASLLPASCKHKILQFEQPRRTEAQIRFGRTATDLNALQVAMFHRNEALACHIISFLRLHADPRELASFLSHVWGNKNTSLHLACFQAMPRLVKLLMELGASPATVNGRKLTPAECCKDPECLARLALPPPQPMVPITIAKRRAPVAPVSIARPATATTTTISSINNSNNSNNNKRSLPASPTPTTARQAKHPPTRSLAVRAPEVQTPIVLDTPPTAPHTAKTIVAVTLPTTAPPVQVQTDPPAVAAARPPPPPPEPAVPLQCFAYSLSITVDKGRVPKTVLRPELPRPPSPMQSSAPSPLKLPLPPPPPERIQIPITSVDSYGLSLGLDPTATVQSQSQSHTQHRPAAPILSRDQMSASEALAKSVIVPAPVKDPSDSTLFHVAAFYLRQVAKALDSHQPRRHPKEGMILLPQPFKCDSVAMGIQAVSHVYREQEVSVP